MLIEGASVSKSKESEDVALREGVCAEAFGGVCVFKRTQRPWGRGLCLEGAGGVTFTATLTKSGSLGNAGSSRQRQPACEIPVIKRTRWSRVIERITSCSLNFRALR